jgi:hypothetical protein
MERAMPMRPRIYNSFSTTMIAVLVMVLCNGLLPAATEDRAASTPTAAAVEQKELPHSPTSTGQARTESAAEPAARRPQEEPSPKPPPGMDIVLPGGKVEAVLAGDVTASTEPVSPHQQVPRKYRKDLPRPEVRAGKAGFGPRELDGGERRGHAA